MSIKYYDLKIDFNYKLLLLLCTQISLSAQVDKSTSIEKIIAFLDFKKNDRVADLGSGDLKKIMKIASHFPNTFFTFQDIDSTHCNLKNLKKRCKKSVPKLTYSNFSLVYGNDNSTNLANNYYDNITIFSSLHEFSNKAKMLQEVKRVLKKGGYFYIFEDLTLDSISLICPNHSAYFKSSEFFQLLKSENIVILDRRMVLEDPDLQEVIFKCVFQE